MVVAIFLLSVPTFASSSVVPQKAESANNSPPHLVFNDSMFPFPDMSQRYQEVEKAVEMRINKYLKDYPFSPWQKEASPSTLENEFWKLYDKRIGTWYDLDSGRELARSSRPDFLPNWKLFLGEKMRCPNCVAFEYNSLSDFYNASLITINGLRFVAMEAPKPHTVNCFFNHILYIGAPAIVRLTAAEENGVQKSAPYWEGLTTGDFLEITEHVKRPKKQLGYVVTEEWEDNTGISAERLLDLILKTRALYDPSKGPLAVHCSAGVGRTGTFIATYAALHEIDRQIANGTPPEKVQISVEEIVLKLSLQRYHMVTKAPQYLTIHETINLYVDTKCRDLKNLFTSSP